MPPVHNDEAVVARFIIPDGRPRMGLADIAPCIERLPDFPVFIQEVWPKCPGLICPIPYGLLRVELAGGVRFHYAVLVQDTDIGSGGLCPVKRAVADEDACRRLDV